MRSFVETKIDGTMPDGRPNSVNLRVASIPALLVMKGYALVGRNKQKDAYDIYFAVRNFQGGLDAPAEACKPLLDDSIAVKGLTNIGIKFKHQDDFGPVTVREFLRESESLGDMNIDQIQVDAFRQVDGLLRRLGMDWP